MSAMPLREEPLSDAQDSAGVQVYVARQPLFNAENQLIGYELLYRNDGAAAGASGVSDRAMSTETVLRSVIGMGLPQLTAGTPAWINFTGELIKERVYELLPKEQVVIEVLETAVVDDALLQELARMQHHGWRVALDDFVLSPGTARLVEYAQFLKVDVLGLTPDRIAELGGLMSGWRKTLLAERVETREVREQCAAAGFALFQGYYFSRPQLVAKKVLPTAQIAAMRLVQQLRDPKTRDAEIIATVGSDVALTYKLLQLVNNAATGGRGVQSLEHALRLLGRQALARWVSLLLVSSLVTGDGTSREVAHISMRRARFAESVARSLGRDDGGVTFLVGLFSMLDALLQMPMAEAIEPLDLAPEVRSALESGTGPHAALLKLAESFERGNWSDVDLRCEALGLERDTLLAGYTEAEHWAFEQLLRA
ncbi:MAG: HDOD domain-containing protein [Gemmatimonadaceae bacterium]|nr:HDOD domain-containing protein [Gemmatimonadaceae bacterium]